MASPVSSISHLLRSLHLRCGQSFRGFHTGKVTSAVRPAEPLDKDTTPMTWDIDADDVLEHPDFFGVNKLVSVKALFEAKVHYGHKYTSLDNRMKQFVFGIRADHVIFDLDITAYHLRQALNFVAHIALRGGIILFVARSPLNGLLIEETALECKEFAHTRYWERSLFTDATRAYGVVTRLPDLIILLSTVGDAQEEHRAIAAANKMLIPTVAIVDSDCNPNQITYPVPGNDDSTSAVKLYCQLFKEAILRGKKERQERLDVALKDLEAEAAAKAEARLNSGEVNEEIVDKKKNTKAVEKAEKKPLQKENNVAAKAETKVNSGEVNEEIVDNKKNTKADKKGKKKHLQKGNVTPETETKEKEKIAAPVSEDSSSHSGIKKKEKIEEVVNPKDSSPNT